VFNIFTNAINRPIPIVDQAVFNVLIQTQPFKDVTMFTDQRSGWAVQLGTTGDPSKIAGFRPNLLEPEPVFNYEDGLIQTALNFRTVCIVHQYDRVPEWKKLVEKKYQQEDQSDYLVIRT